jgi:undecaprenyl diphosphate synthase
MVSAGGPSAEGSQEPQDALTHIDFTRLPRHVAVIMDGNGRWAKHRGLPRVAGHRAGIAAVRDTLEGCARLGIEALTLYAFSRENWKRPTAEINALMRLLREYLQAELEALHERNIRFETIGAVEDLAPRVQEALAHAREKTRENTGMTFLIALSYSGRAELARAARRIAEQAARGSLDPAQVTEQTVADNLYTAGVPDPDLLIRTSGELRVSNYLLWQIAYAELWVTDVLWPDFRRHDLHRAVADFQQRQRRFGGISAVDPRGRGASSRAKRLLSE